MAQDDQMERLRRLRAARNAGLRVDARSGAYVPADSLDFAPTPAPPRRGHGGALAALLVLCVIAGAVIAAVGYGLHSIHSAAGGPRKAVQFVVRPGESVGQIADDLQNHGLVSSGLIFQWYVRINGGAQNFRAGAHQLNTTMSMDDVASTLQQPPLVATPTAPTVTHNGITTAGFPIHFLPGKRAEEIGALLQKNGVVSEAAFMHEVKYGKFNYWFLKSRPPGASLDGFLYTAAPFLVTKHDSAHRIVDVMLAQFNKAFTPTMHLAAAQRHLNAFQIVTMASIIQRESVNSRDLPYISSVYWNHLSDTAITGGLLQADPTVQYAMGYRPAEKTWWEQSPRKIDTSIDSPYNTYKHPGLPPGPISNPDLASLKAAIYPAKSRYLYFQVESRDGGKTYHTYFCVTLECQTSHAGVRIH
jgi:UPF0755 protein